MSEKLLTEDMNAERWVKKFIDRIDKGCDPRDFGVMIGWFANAIMCGHDNARWEAEKEIQELKEKLIKARSLQKKKEFNSRFYVHDVHDF